MDNQSSNLASGSRPGVAKDQLIFIIICSVALAVAAVTLVSFFTRGSRSVRPSQWQCVDANCGHEFTMKKMVAPPVKCPKCGGEAVRLSYRTCPSCGEKVLVCRMQISGQGPGGGPIGGPPGPGMMGMMQPMNLQYWVKQADGSYAWTPWMLGGSPQAMQMDQSLTCTKCGKSLSPLVNRPRR